MTIELTHVAVVFGIVPHLAVLGDMCEIPKTLPAVCVIFGFLRRGPSPVMMMMTMAVKTLMITMMMMMTETDGE